MTIAGIESKKLVDDFRQVAALAGVNIEQRDITVEELPAPHTPPSQLPMGKMAVYVFNWKGTCLKVGKVGAKSQARYVSQHYNPNSSKANLAKSILSDQELSKTAGLSEENIGYWIKRNTDRVNFLLSESQGMPVLTLLEAFLQCRLLPRFEGFGSQR